MTGRARVRRHVSSGVVSSGPALQRGPAAGMWVHGTTSTRGSRPPVHNTAIASLVPRRFCEGRRRGCRGLWLAASSPHLPLVDWAAARRREGAFAAGFEPESGTSCHTSTHIQHNQYRYAWCDASCASSRRHSCGTRAQSRVGSREREAVVQRPVPRCRATQFCCATDPPLCALCKCVPRLAVRRCRLVDSTARLSTSAVEESHGKPEWSDW